LRLEKTKGAATVPAPSGFGDYHQVHSRASATSMITTKTPPTMPMIGKKCPRSFMCIQNAICANACTMAMPSSRKMTNSLFTLPAATAAKAMIVSTMDSTKTTMCFCGPSTRWRCVCGWEAEWFSVMTGSHLPHQVHDREDEHPDHVDEVPVDRRHVHFRSGDHRQPFFQDLQDHKADPENPERHVSAV